MAASPQGLFHDLIQLHLGADTMGTGAIGNVVIDAHGERICLLEHHAHPFPQQVDVDVPVDVLPIQPDITVMRQPSTRSFMRLRDFSNVDFPHPDGPIKALT